MSSRFMGKFLLSTCIIASPSLSTAQTTPPAPTGTFTLIQGSWSPTSAETNPAAINEIGDVVGTYKDGSLMDHGFVSLHDCTKYEPPSSLTCGQTFSLDAPGEGPGYRGGTFLSGIDLFGDIVGLYIDFNGVKHGALWHRTCQSSVCTLNFQSFDAPGADIQPTYPPQGTFPTGISPDGTIIGDYYDQTQSAHTFIARTRRNFFHPEADLTLQFSDIVIPGDTIMYAFSISADDIIAGEGCDASSCSGYIRSPWGHITTFDPQTGGNIQPVAVNAFGTLVGNIYTPQIIGETSFLRTPDGKITTLDFYPAGINDFGVILGQGANGIVLRHPNGSETAVTLPGTWIEVQAVAINDRGWITGSVTDSNFQEQAFVWKP